MIAATRTLILQTWFCSWSNTTHLEQKWPLLHSPQFANPRNDKLPCAARSPGAESKHCQHCWLALSCRSVWLTGGTTSRQSWSPRLCRPTRSRWCWGRSPQPGPAPWSWVWFPGSTTRCRNTGELPSTRREEEEETNTHTHTQTRGYVVGHEDGIFEVRGEINNMRRILCYLEMTRDERRPAESEDDEGWLVTDRSKMVASLFTNWNHFLSLFWNCGVSDILYKTQPLMWLIYKRIS